MNHETQVELIRRILRMQDEGRTEMSAAPYTNRTDVYTAPERLARERALLLRGEPLLAGLSQDAPQPGSYFTRDEGEVPILVVRTKAGELRAFANICAHRGAPVASGSGQSNGRLTCPYHAWSYDEDGRVVSQPCREGFAGVDARRLRLVPLAVAERYGMIFVRAPRPSQAEEAIDVDAHLGGAQSELAAFGLEGYVPFARTHARCAMNWKLVVDTFLEAYHVPALHEQSIGPAILGSPALWDAFGRGGRMVAVRRSIGELRELPPAQWSLLPHSVILYQLFPNTVLIHQIDHIEIVEAWPGPSPGESVVVFSLYTPGAVQSEGARRYFQRNFDVLVRTVGNEDFALCERIQQGFASGMRESVVYGRNEPGLAHFHRMLDETLAAGGASHGCG